MTEEKTYSILCWNTAVTEEKGRKNKDKVFDHINGFLENNDNPIAILQQIPFKDKNNKYNISTIYKEFEKRFNKYQVIKNTDWYDRIVMATAAIIKDDFPIIRDDRKDRDPNTPTTEMLYPKADVFPRNRVIALNIGDKSLEDNDKIENKFSILGLHAQGGSKNISHLKSIPGAADIILGDFNAGNYEESDNKEVFHTLLSDTHVCILNTPTKEVEDKEKTCVVRKTCVDHVFVKRKYVTKISNLIVHENINYSDHYPITFSITV